MFDQRQGVAAVTALAQVAQAAERLAGALDGFAWGATHRLRVRGGNTNHLILVLLALSSRLDIPHPDGLHDGHRHRISYVQQEMNNALERAARQDPTAAHGPKARCLLVHDVATKPGEEERFEFHVDCEVV